MQLCGSLGGKSLRPLSRWLSVLLYSNCRVEGPWAKPSKGCHTIAGCALWPRFKHWLPEKSDKQKLYIVGSISLLHHVKVISSIPRRRGIGPYLYAICICMHISPTVQKHLIQQNKHRHKTDTELFLRYQISRTQNQCIIVLIPNPG